MPAPEPAVAYPDWLDRSAYPFATRYVPLPAGRMHVVDEGEGPPVVMVHGNPAWSFLYRHLVRRLRPTHRCVAMDHLGFGLSDKPRGWSYLPEAHAENLEALIEGLGLRDVTLVVQDWGGPIGLAYAVAHPENVARLVIMNSWAWPVDRDPYYLAFSGFMGGPIGRRLIRRRNFFARAVMRRAYGDPRRLTPEIHAHYLEALPTPDDREGSAVFPRRIVGSTPWLRRMSDGLPALADKPTLIVWGMRDIAFRAKELRRWQSLFPAARTVALDDVGHYVQEEAPERLADEVAAFLGTAVVPAVGG